MPALQRWKIKGTVLSPLHIGCGQMLDPFRCVYSDGKLYEFDISAALAESDPQVRSRLEQRLASPMSNPEQADEALKLLWELPWKKHVKSLFAVGRDARLHFERNAVEAFRTLEVQRFVYDLLSGERILPGSSLKGAMRTGAVSGKSASYAGPVDMRRPQEFEKHVLKYDRIEQDPFGEWSIADAVIKDETTLEQFHVHRLKGAKGPTDYPNSLFEVAPVGGTFETTIVNRARRSVTSKIELKEWISYVRQQTSRTFALAYDELPGSAPKAADDYLADIEDTLKQAETNPLGCVVRLGRFSGFLNMTVDKQRILKEHRGHREELRGDDANPLTRALTTDGQPFGFIKLEFEPL